MPSRSVAPRHAPPVLVLLGLLGACSRPDPPTLVPDKVKVTAMSMSRLDLAVTLKVTNPNSVGLVARTVHAHVVVADKFDLGTVDIPVVTSFPAGKTTPLEVPLSVQVRDVAPLAQLAVTQASLPYTVEGTVGLGGDLLHVDLPFRLADSVPRDQVVHAAMGAIPGLGSFGFH